MSAFPGISAPLTGVAFDQVDVSAFGAKAGSSFGSFATDRATAISNARMAQYPAANGDPAQQESRKGFGQATVLRYSYLGSMTRVDDIAQNTATITRPDLHQTIYLDLTKKTYKTAPLASSASAKSTTVSPEMLKLIQQTTRNRPNVPYGTAALVYHSAVTSLPKATYERYSVDGYRVTFSMKLEPVKACTAMSTQMTSIEYVARSIPNPPTLTPALPTGLAGTQDRGTIRTFLNCRITHRQTASQTNGVIALQNAFYVYRSIETMTSMAGFKAPSISLISERGNIKILSNADLPLFSAPSDFSKAP